MSQTKAQLLDFANECAAGLNLGAITQSVFEDWINEGFLPRATPLIRQRGRSALGWNYPDEALSIVRTIVEIRSRGARRHSQLRLYLWISGLDVPSERVKDALISEHYRLAQLFQRGSRFRFDHRYEKLTDKKRTRLADRFIPDQAKRLPVGGLAVPIDLIAYLLSQVESGRGEDASISELIFDAVKDGVAGLAPELGEVASSVAMSFDIEGLLGMPDEISDSGAKALAKLSVDDLNISRFRITEFFRALGIINGHPELGDLLQIKIDMRAFSELSKSLLKANALVLLLAMFSIDTFRRRKTA